MKKTTIALAIFASTSAFASSYHLITPFEPLAKTPAELELRLDSFALPKLTAGVPYESPSLSSLIKAYGQRLNLNEAELSSPNLPAGLSIQNNKIVGTPMWAGESSFTLVARARGAEISRNYRITADAVVSEVDGVRTWSDSSIASSCSDYLTGSANYQYAGATGDGVYRIAPSSGQQINVYCDMTRDGGGWALVMKQGSGAASRQLQGDSVYFTAGTVLNDSVANLNKSNANLVSAGYTLINGTQLRLEAGNETTMKYHTTSTSQPAFNSFTNNTRVLRQNKAGDPGTVVHPNWYLHTTHYASGPIIKVAQFGVNLYANHNDYPVPCAVRWGWIANQDPEISTGSDDYCAGLGYYGSHIDGAWMGGVTNHHTAPLYLWIK